MERDLHMAARHNPRYPLHPDDAFCSQVRNKNGSLKLHQRNKTQARELTRLRRRWLQMAKRWNIKGWPGEVLSSEAWPDLSAWERDVRDWGRRHGFICDGPEEAII